MQCFVVNPSTLSGEISAPPSKSHTLRAIMLASLAEGQSVIERYLVSPDTEAMINACSMLGAEIVPVETAVMPTLRVTGVSGKIKQPDDIIDCGNSGQVLRFIAAIAALNGAGYTVLTGDRSLRYNRPIQPLIDGLRGLGAFCVSIKDDGHAPIIVKGPISAGKTALDGEDSQPVSALLFASAFLAGTTEITVSNAGEKPWVDLTLSWLKKIGVQVEHHKHKYYKIQGKGIYHGFTYRVPSDISSVLFPVTAAILTEGSEVVIRNIDLNDVQGDKRVIDILISMGADIVCDEEHETVTARGGRKLQGCEIDANDFVDAVPLLAVVGCFAQGKTTIYNAEIARKKECDRVCAITQELKRMGAYIEEFVDGLTVKTSELKGTTVYTYKDHRMVMSLFLAGLMAKGATIIEDVECVAKSYADFLEDMRILGAGIDEIR